MGQGQHAITYEEALKLTEGAGDVHRVLLENAPRNKNGGDRKSAKANQKSPTTSDLVPYRSGAKKVTLAIRLAQEKPKHYSKLERGEYKSITEAARAAGLIDHANHANLNRAKSAFRNMTDKEQAEFLKWLKTDDAKKGGNS
jgi:hypothetical protein